MSRKDVPNLQATVFQNLHPELAASRCADIVQKRKASMAFEAIGKLWDISRQRVLQIYNSDAGRTELARLEGLHESTKADN